MDAEFVPEQDVFTEELRILKDAKASLSLGQTPDAEYFKRLVYHYEKLLKTSIKLSKVSDIQGRTLKEREQELNAAHTELQNLEQLRRQLITDISHELRTPITAVQGYVKAFLDGVIEPDRPYLNMLYEKLLTINQLISDLFQFSTLQASRLRFHIQPVSIKLWLHELYDKYTLEAKRRQIQFTLEPSVLTDDPGLNLDLDRACIMIDTVRMEQVVTNLLDNAFKYTPPNGTVQIRGQVTRHSPDHSRTEADASLAGRLGWFTLFVEDNGPGIDQSELTRVFDRFYRADRTGIQGTGLGLAIAREIIHQHSGMIAAESTSGKGSVFRFSLPAYDHMPSP